MVTPAGAILHSKYFSQRLRLYRDVCRRFVIYSLYPHS
nr:MAG TPA: hypothetical protein [Caudoviricetes sp.]